MPQPSQVMHETAMNASLRNRIEALVRSTWWNDQTADPAAPVPTQDLAWAVATNPTILASVTEAAGGVGTNIWEVIDSIAEGDLEYVVLTSLTRLANSGEATP